MEKILKPNLVKRLVVYCFGLFLMALGVSFSVTSNLGVSPVNSIPKVLSEIFTVISMGTWATIVFCCFILIQLVVLGRKFHPSRFLQVLGSFVFGWFVDLTNWLTGMFLPVPEHYVVRLLYLVISMAIVGLGIMFYLAPKILSLPGEGVMQAISEKYGFALYKCKMGFDASVVLIAAAASLGYFHYFNGVREGTIIAALGVGKFLGVFSKLLSKRVNTFLEMDTPAEKKTAVKETTKQEKVPVTRLVPDCDTAI